MWRMPMAGGEETPVLDHVVAGYSALLDEGICFLDRHATPRFTIEFFNFATRQTARVTTVEKDADIPRPRGFAVSPDGRWVLYKRGDQIENVDAVRRVVRERLGRRSDSAHKSESLTIANARLLIARMQGFRSWADLESMRGD